MDKNAKKQLLRKTMLKKRAGLAPSYVSKAGEKALAVLTQFIAELSVKKSDSGMKESLTIMSYMSYKNEFPTSEINRMILREGHRLVLPYTDDSFTIIPCYVTNLAALVTSQMGIPEPDPASTEHAALSDIDLILMPGVAFDLHGNRIGFGKGCYDRFLASASDNSSAAVFAKDTCGSAIASDSCPETELPAPLLLALAYDFQIHEEIPAEDTDVPCSYLLSESGLHKI